MDLKSFLTEASRNLTEIKGETYEIRQLLKYCFNEDIIEDLKPDSPRLAPVQNVKKNFVFQNRYTAGLTKKNHKIS